MSKTLLLLSLAVSMVAEDATMETFVFGTSWHSNRDRKWNEVNPGLGLGMAWHKPDNFDTTFACGSYIDSYNNHAFFLMPGFRWIWGNREAFHVNANLNIGIMKGSGQNGIGMMPYLSVGYNRVDLCVTGEPAWVAHQLDNPNNEPNKWSSGFVGFFLKFNVANF